VFVKVAIGELDGLAVGVLVVVSGGDAVGVLVGVAV